MRPLDALPLPQDRHLHLEADIQEPRRRQSQLRPRANVANPLHHLPQTIISVVFEGESGEHTRCYGVTGLPLPQPEHCPKCKGSENRSNAAKDQGPDTAGTPL